MADLTRQRAALWTMWTCQRCCWSNVRSQRDTPEDRGGQVQECLTENMYLNGQTMSKCGRVINQR